MFTRWRRPAVLAGSFAVTGAPTAQAATVDPTARYVLVNRNSGKAVEVRNASTADGTHRAQTSMANFPNGFGNTQIVLSDAKFALFEATNSPC